MSSVYPPVTHYIVTYNNSNTQDTTATTEIAITDGKQHTAYEVTVAAVNVVGPGPPTSLIGMSHTKHFWILKSPVTIILYIIIYELYIHRYVPIFQCTKYNISTIVLLLVDIQLSVSDQATPTSGVDERASQFVSIIAGIAS